MVKAALVWDDRLLRYDFGPNHPLRSERCRMGVEELEKIDGIDLIEPRYATEEELKLVHTEDYIEAVKMGRAGDIDTPIDPGIYDPARLSVGATLRAIELVMKEGYRLAVNICGGWHHAFEDRARGFCIFNDVAIGARYAQKLGARKVFVVDWDVHHGDGTQRIFLEDDSVFTLSIHQHPSTQYPYTSGYESENTKTNLNIPIRPGTSESEILKMTIPTMITRIRAFLPDILLVQMGVDGHRDDPMSGIEMSEKFYDSASKTLGRCAKNLKIPVVLLGGGGFNFPRTAQLWRMIVENFMEHMG